MSWVFVGVFLGAVITSGPYDDREKCEGKAVILKETKGLVGSCQQIPNPVSVSPGLFCGNGICGIR